MSVRVFLDSVEITAALNAQYPLPAKLTNTGIFPDNSRAKWYDLLAAINDTPGLKDKFFDSTEALHELKLEDTSSTSFAARIFLSTKYASRNR